MGIQCTVPKGPGVIGGPQRGPREVYHVTIMPFAPQRGIRSGWTLLSAARATRPAIPGCDHFLGSLWLVTVPFLGFRCWVLGTRLRARLTLTTRAAAH
jgi:hypothetical protein